MKRILIIWALLISVCFAQSKAGFYVVGGKIITVQDTSSRKYLKAIENAGIVPSVTQNFASNYLVTIEKAIGSYSLIKAQYPFIGGTAGTHKFNMNDPRDLDAAYRLTYSGTVLHDANGINSQTGGYANTNLTPSTAISSVNSNSLGIYVTSITTPNNFVDIGVTGSTSGISQRFALRAAFDNSSNKSASFGSGQSSPLTDANSTSFVTGKAMILGTRSSSTSNKIFINGILENTNTVANTGSLPTSKLRILSLNDASGNLYPSKRSLGYVFIYNGSFTDTQSIQQSKIVTFAQGILSRQ